MAGHRTQAFSQEEKSLVGIRDVEQVLRQQIGFARRFHSQLAGEVSLPAKRASAQASLLCLNLGLSSYIQSIMNWPRLDSLAHLNQISIDMAADAKQEEIAKLLGGESWLSSLVQVVDSFSNLPPTKSSFSQPGHLIASSSGPLHWANLNLNEIESYILAIEEMLDRHAETDHEY